MHEIKHVLWIHGQFTEDYECITLILVKVITSGKCVQTQVHMHTLIMTSKGWSTRPRLVFTEKLNEKNDIV